MAYITYINFYKTLEAALTVDESPQVDKRLGEYRGIQLLPNDPLPYVQVTQHPTGINLEDWTVKVYSTCGKLLGDITASFLVDEPWIDDLGMPQIKWSLKNVPEDFGPYLIYLEITQTVGETFWTNPFQLTALESEFTTRFDYTNNTDFDYFQSVRLITWYRDTLSRDEQNLYDEKSTDFTVTKNTIRRRPRQFWTTWWNNNLFVTFADMLTQRFVYVNLVRHFSYEPFEIPNSLGNSNKNEKDYLLTPYWTDTYDPLYVAPVPEPPVIGGDLTITVKGLIRTEEFPPSYRCKLSIPTVEGYETVIQGFSTIIQNDVTNGFSLLVSVVDGVINILSNYVPEGEVPGLEIANFTVRVSNGTDQLNYVFTTGVAFNNIEIFNGVEKDVTATIESV